MIRYLLAKYLRAEPDFGFITLTKWLAFVGIALGVAVLLVAMAVMNGLNISFEQRLLAMNYPLTLYPHTEQARFQGAALLPPLGKDAHASDFISAQAAIKNGAQLDGTALFGVDFEREIHLNPILASALKTAAERENLSTKELAKRLNQGFYIITGARLAANIDARKGDKLALIFSRLSPAGLHSAPVTKRFELAATFSSGLNSYDSAYAFTSLTALKRIKKSSALSGVHIAAPRAQELAKTLSKGPAARHFLTVGWWEQNGSIIAAMALEKRALFLILAMLVLIAALNIITSLLMIVLNRRKEIALLLALGASAREVRGAFFAVGFAIGAAGTAAGAALGAAAIWALGRFDLIELPADVYGSSRLPLDLSALDGWLIITGALAISAVAALYPAAKAARIDVLATLRQD